MNYRVTIASRAEKQMADLKPQFIKRIRNAIMNLRENPRPPGAVKLKNNLGFRVRVGDYRVIYAVSDTNRSVLVTAVRHRREAYR